MGRTVPVEIGVSLRLPQPVEGGVETSGLQALLGESQQRLQPALGKRPRERHALQVTALQQPDRLGLLGDPIPLQQPPVAGEPVENPTAHGREVLRRGAGYRQQFHPVVVEQFLVEPHRLREVVRHLVAGQEKQLPCPGRIVDIDRVVLLGAGRARPHEKNRGGDQQQRQAATFSSHGWFSIVLASCKLFKHRLRTADIHGAFATAVPGRMTPPGTAIHDVRRPSRTTAAASP